MTDVKIEHISDCQASLIEALDNQDVSAIETQTKRLSMLIGELQNVDIGLASIGRFADPEALDYALRQSTAASIRVNHLSHWTRQRIDRLAQLRGLTDQGGYDPFLK